MMQNFDNICIKFWLPLDWTGLPVDWTRLESSCSPILAFKALLVLLHEVLYNSYLHAA